VVRVTSAIPYCMDTLFPKFDGEGIYYQDPREAVKIAIRIWRKWEEESGCCVTIQLDNDCGLRFPLEAQDIVRIQEWAKNEAENESISKNWRKYRTSR